MHDVVIAVHGGAGSDRMLRAAADWEEAVRAGLRTSLAAGYRVLAGGGSALDAVEQAVRELERDEHFNAGRGSVLDARGEVTMDASIMDGAKRSAGAVAAVTQVVHPICAARLVMSETPHVLLVGADALAHCRQHGLETAAPEHFITEVRKRELDEIRRRGASAEGPDLFDSLATVGAVALDRHGNLAAATSTGGTANRLPGRVGDSALIGAGTWADNATCAVSATGIGETIIRAAFAHEVDALMRYRNLALGDACRAALGQVVALGGAVGCVAIDAGGRTAQPFSTPAMPRGVMRGPDDVTIAIRRSE